MKQLLSSYSVAGNVVTLTGVNRPQESILSITDASTGTILYTAQTGGATAYSQGASSTITLSTTPGSSDRLQIYYDDGVASTNAPTSVSVSNFPSTQPVSGSVSVSNFPTSTEISNDVGNPIPVSGTVTANTGLTQPLTDTQLRATPVPVSGTFYQATQPVSLASVPSHPVTNAGTFAVQNTAAVVGGNSLAVKVDGSAVTQPVSGTFWQSTQPVSLSSLPALATGTNSIGAINNTSTQFSKVAISTATLTRPANTTAYTANAVVSNSTSAGTVITFSNVLPVNQGDGYIVAVRAMTNQTAFATAIRLHLYKTSPNGSVVLNDAAAFKLLIADVGNRIGYVDISGWTTGGSGSDAATAFGIFPGSGSSLPLELDTSSTTLYGILETRATFTPASGQQFVFSLKTQLA